MNITHAWAAQDAQSKLAPFEYKPRELREHDVQIDVLFCGVCHSDLHQARNEWKNTVFPVVPGHEIVGRVTAIGSHVHKYNVGDLVGVGCLVDSCRTCDSCKEDLEQYCENGFTGTYNGQDRITGETTYGGYSTQVVVTQDFVLRVPENLDPAGAAPLLCAGITTYSPLHHWGAGPGKKVGIVGLGGLGHMGVKIAHAMGAHVVLFTTSPSKIEDGKRLGAHEVVISKDADQMAAHANSFDLIVNTVAVPHDLNPFITLLRRDGTLTLVGVPEHDHPSPQVFNLIFKRRSVAGSLIGGIKETQEMLDFCGKHNLTSDIELIRMDEINEAYERMLKSDAKYRFVIDIDTLRN
ncbi:NAD(P)-dependent alcohol dehydrogenase [Erwinia tracheiphila]|uniref:Hydroxyacid dehydrogenase n=1 Tax=Erwinia tracheiphila TaxID=65700 RepID=A0A0M2KIL8_9GAMM|nr:NAD(P)-dependent alcohol dehydrogenase [Erwinia tracheiphila]EOS95299.1 Zinc-containing alcohol dehydrogenase superfamily protein [Erwinia tracheiphila PSU-1]KKF37078.1 hydroxyacid dehydrogenase [Erwinia tracheiphila]UIA88446.1 NAD(P)-dependent alcohol dehydrogenase [Erwinia tracheiphila]UIA96822.1 NAD(P)-dependent alcohol dehydrogenase [Erwinia tracheiphila]